MQILRHGSTILRAFISLVLTLATSGAWALESAGTIVLEVSQTPAEYAGVIEHRETMASSGWPPGAVASR